MRRILLDRVRRRLSSKRGGNQVVALDLDSQAEIRPDWSREIVALDDALNALAQIDPRKAHIVELRFFGGLSTDEIGMIVNISARLEAGASVAAG